MTLYITSSLKELLDDFFQATVEYDSKKCDRVSGNRMGNVALYIGDKYRSSIQPEMIRGESFGFYEYCIPFSKMQDDDGKLEKISFVPDNNGVSLCLTDHE